MMAKKASTPTTPDDVIASWHASGTPIEETTMRRAATEACATHAGTRDPGLVDGVFSLMGSPSVNVQSWPAPQGNTAYLV